MDGFQLIVTTTAIIIVLLLMVYFACHLFGPKTNAWLRSTREEKIGLSHKKLYNANGFLIRSGSDFLLSSTGSFKRFDSVDRDCKQQDARYSPAPSSSSAVSPLWNLPDIPAQPLRPAPSPPPSATTPKLHFFATHSAEQQQQHPSPHHHHPIKQQSWSSTRSSSNSSVGGSSSASIVSTSTAAVPRPVAKRQFSTTSGGSPSRLPEISPIKLPPAAAKRKSHTQRTNTNPFLNSHDQQHHPSAEDSVAETISNPSRCLPDLISDSILLDCERRLRSVSSSEEPESAGALPSGNSASGSGSGQSSNPFCVSPQIKSICGSIGGGGSSVQIAATGNGREVERLGVGVVVVDVKSSQEVAAAKPLDGCEPLIFNFETVAVAVPSPSAGECSMSNDSTGGKMSEKTGEDLISLEEEASETETKRNKWNKSSLSGDEKVESALREAAGSIRKLELARVGAAAEAMDTTAHMSGDEMEGRGDEDGDKWRTTAKISEIESSASYLLESATNSNNNNKSVEKRDPHPSLPHHPPLSRLSKYDESFSPVADDMPEDFYNYRRFRSHSETEATIFDRAFALHQQRRLMLVANNPFLNPDLVATSSTSTTSNNNNNRAGGSFTACASPAKGALIRSNAMMGKQLQLQQQQEYPQQCSSNNNNNNPSNSVNNNPYTLPAGMSKTVSETYLEQFMGTSSFLASTSSPSSGGGGSGGACVVGSLPRSSSILQLLEQQQQLQREHQREHQRGPPWAAAAFMEGNRNSSSSCCGGGGATRRASYGGGGGFGTGNGSNGICTKPGAALWRQRVDCGDSSEKVNVFADGGAAVSTPFKRTLSSESVSSQSSVLIADLEPISGNNNSAAVALAGDSTASVAGRARDTTPPVTGYLCVGLQYDKNNVNEEGAELVVTVLEAKELLGPADGSTNTAEEDAMDTFVRIYLVPDEERAMQTKLFKNSSCPSYNETFSFWVSRKHQRHSLWFHLYHSGMNQHTLIGEAELQIGDVKRPLTTWLALSDSRHANNAMHNYGELMFSLSYLPTAERLTVVVVKGRNLQFSNESSACGENANDDKRISPASSSSRRSSIQESLDGVSSRELSCMSLSEESTISEVVTGEPRKRHSCTTLDGVANVLVKVYLLKDGKKVSKKKTTVKRMESSPIYNESMIFSVPPYMLSSIQIRLTVAQIVDGEAAAGVVASLSSSSRMQIVPIGHVIVGNETTGKGLKHWNQMITSLRKPVAMWHPLRRCSPPERQQQN